MSGGQTSRAGMDSCGEEDLGYAFPPISIYLPIYLIEIHQYPKKNCIDFLYSI